MSEIPRDIINEAAKACKVYGILGNERTAQKLLENVAKAIWAERQRCAKIAEDEKVPSHSTYHSGWVDCAAYISQAILSDKEES